jgi:hypothetical protein
MFQVVAVFSRRASHLGDYHDYLRDGCLDGRHHDPCGDPIVTPAAVTPSTDVLDS